MAIQPKTSRKRAGSPRSKPKRPQAPRSTEAVSGSQPDTTSQEPEYWNLRLYVAGQTPKSISAFSNLKRHCETHLPGRYKIEVIDLVENPQLAAGDQIIAVPTLVRKLPAPLKRVIGNLSDEQKFLVGLDLKPASLPTSGT